ncbi:MAG: replication-relaxation family protein [Verrucomicrobia bacterium]|nr:replication-relaxation family protein [Verrucomicrobiota bacterium]
MRKPRFERTDDALGLQLTPRDLEIFQHIARHRFLSSRQIVMLVGGSAQHILKRLQRLFHHGYLDRPRAQVRYFSEDGSRPLVYALTSTGARALPEDRRPARADNRNVKQLYIEHSLLVADVVIAFARACATPGTPRIVHEDGLGIGKSAGATFKWVVTVRHHDSTKRVGVVPDRVFALDSHTSGERQLFFIEADRATMPVARSSLAQSSLLRKLLAYEATWREGVHRQRFGSNRFRVLVVTSSAERAQHVAKTCAELPRGRGLFLFTDADSLRGYITSSDRTGVLTLPWTNATGGTERLINSFVREKAA